MHAPVSGIVVGASGVAAGSSTDGPNQAATPWGEGVALGWCIVGCCVAGGTCSGSAAVSEVGSHQRGARGWYCRDGELESPEVGNSDSPCGNHAEKNVRPMSRAFLLVLGLCNSPCGIHAGLHELQEVLATFGTLVSWDLVG